MFTVYNVGLIYVDMCSRFGHRLLVPNGRRGDLPQNVPPHFASVFVAADKVDMANTKWWWGSKIERETTFVDGGKNVNVDVYEFRIKEPSAVTFPVANGKRTAPSFGNVTRLPMFAGGFELDDEPDLIAEVPIRSGTLEALQLQKVPVVRWTLGTLPAPVTIAVETRPEKPANGGRRKAREQFYITLKNDVSAADIVFSNTPDFLTLHDFSGNGNGAGHEGHASREGHDHLFEHGVVYAKLNRGRTVVPLPQDRVDLPVLDRMTRGYLKFLRQDAGYQQSDCTPTCCRTGGGGGG